MSTSDKEKRELLRVLSTLDTTDNRLETSVAEIEYQSGSPGRESYNHATRIAQNPPQDTGRAAYQTLIAAIVFESVVIGLPLAYGVFQEHYTQVFPGNTIAPWIGVLSSGLPFLGAPAMTYACEHYTISKRWYILSGWSLCVLSLLSSAFSQQLKVLVVLQGFTYGIGAMLTDIPVLLLLNTWFEARRGVAYGLVFGAADLVAVAYTFLIIYLLSQHGLQITIAVLAAIIFLVAGPAILLLKPREVQDPSKHRRESSHSDLLVRSDSFHPSAEQVSKRYYKRIIFYILITVNIMQSLAFYLPFIYSPSFTTDMGHPRNIGAWVLSVANLAQVFGEVGFGKLSDMIHVKYLVVISTVVSGLVVLLLWGLLAASSAVALFFFAFLFGCFGSGFLALYARMGTIFGEVDAPMVYSTLCLGRGLGSIVSGPISSSLLSLSSNRPITETAFGAGKYMGIVLFVGCNMAGSAIVGVCGIITLAWKAKETSEEEKRLNNGMPSRSASIYPESLHYEESLRSI